MHPPPLEDVRTLLRGLLTQVLPGPGCAFYSKSNSPAERNYSAFKGELMAALAAINHWHCYLGSAEFDLITDHRALEWLFSAQELPAMLSRYVLRLSEYNINIRHRPGAQNSGPDFLSRYRPAATTAEGSNPTSLTVFVSAAETQLRADVIREAMALAVDLRSAQGEAPWDPHADLRPGGELEDLADELDVLVATAGAHCWLPHADGHSAGPSSCSVSSPAELQMSSSPSAVSYFTAVQNDAKADAGADANGQDPWEDPLFLECLRAGDAGLNGLSHHLRDRLQHRMKRYVLETVPGPEPHERLEQLWFVTPGASRRLVPQPGERIRIIERAHGLSGVAHMGAQRTYAALEQLYRWPGMYAQVAAVVRDCAACSRAKATTPLKNPVLDPLPVVPFLYRISMDLFGPCPVSRYGNTYGGPRGQRAEKGESRHSLGKIRHSSDTP